MDNSDAFDYDIAGARVLGRDIGKILSDKTAKFVNELLDEEINHSEKRKLILTLATSYSFKNNSVEYFKSLLRSLRTGITEMRAINR